MAAQDPGTREAAQKAAQASLAAVSAAAKAQVNLAAVRLAAVSDASNRAPSASGLQPPQLSPHIPAVRGPAHGVSSAPAAPGGSRQYTIPPDVAARIAAIPMSSEADGFSFR